MKCIKCGEEIPDGSTFCNKCGASQEGNNNQSVNNSEQNIVGNPRNKFLKMPKNQKSMIIIFLVIMAVITYYINSNNTSSQSVNNTYSESSSINSIIDQSSDDSSIDTNSTYTDENSTYQATDSSETNYGTNLNSDSTESYNLDDDASEEPVADDEKGACWALAEDVVKANLKSPSTAKFPFSYGSDGVSITKSGNFYTVSAWVDAENSYGAKLRNNFMVTMTKSGYGDNTKFTAESCDID